MENQIDKDSDYWYNKYLPLSSGQLRNVLQMIERQRYQLNEAEYAVKLILENRLEPSERNGVK